MYFFLIFNKVSNLSFVSNFKIFRETSISNVFEFIGNVNKNNLSIFNDNTSFPQSQSYAYKIQTIDNCGNSSFGDIHKSIHLTINKGLNDAAWNLIWTPYQGKPVVSYQIWRGTSIKDLTFIGGVAGGATSFTDNKAPVSTNSLIYMVAILLENSCNPTARIENYESIRSNLVNTRLSSYDIIENLEIAVYPNPSKDFINIINVDKNEPFTIYDINGIIVLQAKNNDTVNIESLKSGVYYVKIKNKTLKFIKI